VNITLHQLEIFHAVTVTGSISKAARRIGISQPAVSQQLSKLEECLGVPLITRNRTGFISLTVAGEFWSKSSKDLLSRIETVVEEHEQNYSQPHVHVKLGVTPNLRGIFISSTARIVQKDSIFITFELTYDVDHAGLAEKLKMHKINFAILEASALKSEGNSFHSTPLYKDFLTWAVPASVEDADIIYALNPLAVSSKVNPILNQYINMAGSHQAKMQSDEWFQTNLPHNVGTLTAPTCTAALELVADGIATSHAYLSLLPNLPTSILKKIKFYNMNSGENEIVLAMRKHLMTHRSYSRIYNSLVDYCVNEHARAMSSFRLLPLP
jgi:DNA-binding transcriptional LysR family regulator